MDLKVNNTTFCGTYIPKTYKITKNTKYNGTPNFRNNINLNPKLTFAEKIGKFFKALYYANFK